MAYQNRGRTFDEFTVGDTFETAQRTVTEADIAIFAGLSGDYNPLHTNDEYAKTTPFGRRIAHGLLTFAITTGLINQLGIFEGTTLGLLGTSEKFKNAVLPGDTIRVVIEVVGKKETSKPGRGILEVKTSTINQREEVVLEGTETIMLVRK